MKNTFSLLFLLLATIGVHAQESRTRVIYIADSKRACEYQNTIMACLKVKNHPDSAWKDFPYAIEGFIFEHGFQTIAEVEETPVLNPGPDMPGMKYKLLRVIESKSTVLDNKQLLKAGKWKLLNIEIDRVITPAKRSNAYLYFDTDSNRISGFSGCNSFGGNTRIENGVLTFGLLQSTLLSCSNEQTEKMLMEGLKGKAAYYIRNKILFVVCENHTVLHFRSEMKLDSLIAELEKPTLPARGNTFADLQNGSFVITLDDIPEYGGREFMMNSSELSPTEKQTLLHRLKSADAASPFSEIQILKKTHKVKGMYHAVLLMKDGSKRNLILRNVL